LRFDILLYDLTSTYFESDLPTVKGLRRYGYSRDKRPACVQVGIALIVTPEGFPLAYEVMPGNTSDKTSLADFLQRIEAHIFVAYCLQVTLKQRLRALAPGLTPRAVLEKFVAMQMVDVHLPTTAGTTAPLKLLPIVQQPLPRHNPSVVPAF
jgi:hypothetical protein